jgi:hypothetical protein
VGSVGARKQLVEGQARGIIDLGENGDVMSTIIGGTPAAGGAEELRQVAQIPARSTPGGTVKWRATHGVVASATTVIGSTATR